MKKNFKVKNASLSKILPRNFGQFLMRRNRSGMALVVVLALIILMLGVVMAFFSQSQLQRQISGGSSNQIAVDMLSQDAIDTIVGDLRLEIATNSIAASNTNINAAGIILYRPKKGFEAPVLAGTNKIGRMQSALPNLLKISASGSQFAQGVDGRAMDLSTTNRSLNGRFISMARWNKPLLLPKANASSATDLTPIADFTAPDWILVNRAGRSETNWNKNMKWTSVLSDTNVVVGRYAYAIYNEGGLLDANVAGYPEVIENTPLSGGSPVTNQTLFKGAASYADLSVIGLRQDQIEKLVGWRNNASLGASGDITSGYSFSSPQTASSNYFNLANQNPNNFLRINDLTATSDKTDRIFASRQHLIDFMLNGIASSDAEKADLQNSLQYLGTFSRSLNRPSYFPIPKSEGRPTVVPPPQGLVSDAVNNDDVFNPSFGFLKVAMPKIERNDGSVGKQGEPLISQRFALNRLTWLTYRGPSAGLDPADPLVGAYAKYGISWDFLQQGTQANILKYFGLRWWPATTARAGYWEYVNLRPGSSTIYSLEQIRDNLAREPNFFELLEAGIHVGALARARVTDISADDNLSNKNLLVAPIRLAYDRDSRVDFQVFAIGANMIDQVAPDCFPTTIVVNDGAQRYPFYGKVDLPYLMGIAEIAIINERPVPDPPTTLMPVMRVATVPAGPPIVSRPGKAVCLMVPIVWNPHAQKSIPFVDGLYPLELRASVSSKLGYTPSAQHVVRKYFPRWNIENWSAPRFKILLEGGAEAPEKFQQGYRPPPGGDRGDDRVFASGNLSAPTGMMAPSTNEMPWNLGSKLTSTTGELATPNSGDNTFLYFRNLPDFYREPTPLWLANNTPTPVTIDSDNLIVKYGGSDWIEGIPEVQAPGETSTRKFVGFFAGISPMRWNVHYSEDTTKTPPLPALDAAYTVNNIGQSRDGGNAHGLTVTLEYKDPVSGVWSPYQQSFPTGNYSTISVPQIVGNEGPAMSSGYPGSLFAGWKTGAVRYTDLGFGMRMQGIFDPRTTRWANGKDFLIPAFLNDNGTQVSTLRPGAGSEPYVQHGSDLLGVASENLPGPSNNITDADGTVRRASGAYAAGATTGLPMATATAENSSRPLVLHRPFRSVAELGYVFSDTPWKNLDFSTPESGFKPLLDVFCVNDEERTGGLEAGRVDLNTRQTKVLEALLAGTYRNELNVGLEPVDGATDEPAKIASAIVAKTTGTIWSNGEGGLANISDIVGKYIGGSGRTIIYRGIMDDLDADVYGTDQRRYKIQRFRETALRALTSSGQAGTWNLLIDVIAQTGRYPISADTKEKFLVEAEKRYWVHVAIDRQTGEIIDKQVELVKE